MRSAMEAAAVRVAPSMNPQDVANTVWALATLEWQANAEVGLCFQKRVEALLCYVSFVQFSAKELSQLLQAHLASQFLRLDILTLPVSSLQVAVKAYREEARGGRGVARSTRGWRVPAQIGHTT